MIDFKINAVAQINHSKKWFVYVIALFFFCQVALGQKVNVLQKKNKKEIPTLQQKLKAYLDSQPAKIGVALKFIPYNDSLAFAQNPNQGKLKYETFDYHGNDSFLMMSVAKLPLAIYTLMLVEGGTLSLDTQIAIDSNDLARETHSPTVNGKTEPFKITLREAIDASVGLSDNITTDKIFDLVGGPQKVEDFLQNLGYKNMHVRSNYRTMTESTLGMNCSSPLAMNKLLFELYYGLLTKPEHTKYVYALMKNTPTGPMRIRKELPSTVEFAHKTGTYYNDTVIKAINDVGIMKLKTGLVFLTVFVNDSKLTPAETEKILSTIGKRVYEDYGIMGL
jgi:beta-lactamase class A